MHYKVKTEIAQLFVFIISYFQLRSYITTKNNMYNKLLDMKNVLDNNSKWKNMLNTLISNVI